ncbi:MAG: hypothetical protein JNL21_25655 [Myxococcales bacterium]|nr:hypothetical protein [Myxococcales bacterium]
MISLHPSEAEVVQVARSILGLLPGRAAVDLLSTPRKRPAMRPEAIEVLEDTLRKGLVRSLVRRGGGRRSRSLDANGGVSKKGRVWERHEAPPFRVTAATAHLLAYLVSSDLGAGQVPRRAPPPLALGDEIFFYLAAERCLEAGFAPVLGAYPFSASVLASVAFPVHVGAAPQPRFGVLLDGPGAIVVEALEADLASKIVLAERSRRQLASPAGVSRATESIRDRTVAFVRAALEAGRPDLGLFVLRGIDSLLVAPRGTEPAAWMPRAAEPLPLSARQDMARSALAWFEVVDVYRAVQKRARSVGFVDDDFDRAQHILTALEAVPLLGPARAPQLDSLVRALSGLEAAQGPSLRGGQEP